VYGYQLKEGKAKRGHIADESIDKSFLIQGAGTKRTVLKDSKGWISPNKDVIDSFFGESGKHWTPERWKAFGYSGAAQNNGSNSYGNHVAAALRLHASVTRE
jgi:hypothetical protein